MRTFTFIFLLVFFTICAYAEENITITTYYPSPSGSYLDLNTQGTLLIGTGTPTTGVASPRIEFSHNTSAAYRHWNIDQRSSDTNNPELRFFTQPNNNIGGEEDRLVINNDNMIFTGTTNNGNFILKATSVDTNDAGDIIFQSGTSIQKGRVWTESATSASGLYLSSGDNTSDIAIDSNGDVGIGTTTPRARLDLGTSGAIGIGDESITCNNANKGVTRFHNNLLEVCKDNSSGHPAWSGVGELNTQIVGGIHGSSHSSSVGCPTGTKVVGGGCYQGSTGAGQQQWLTDSYPVSNGWRCSGGGGGWASPGFAAYAICAKIE